MSCGFRRERYRCPYHDPDALAASYEATPPHSQFFRLITAKVKSYEGVNSTGSVQITGGDLAALEGKNVLVVEDIINTGERSSDFTAHVHRGRTRQPPLQKRKQDLT